MVSFFALLGSAWVKAARKMKVKLTPYRQYKKDHPKHLHKNIIFDILLSLSVLNFFIHSKNDVEDMKNVGVYFMTLKYQTCKIALRAFSSFVSLKNIFFLFRK